MSAAAAGRRVPLPPMQRIAAEHLMRSAREAVAVTMHGSADVQALLALRERLNAVRPGGARISLTHLVAKALAQALGAHPALNATLDGREVVLHGAVHLGLAQALADGTLVVPVLRDAGRLAIGALAAEARALAARAAAGKLRIDDVRGATFTLSNGGQLPSARWTTPIIPLGQAAILALGAVHDAPAAVGGAVVVRPLLPLSLSFDHRFVNGVPAARFFDEVQRLIAAPEAIGLEGET